MSTFPEQFSEARKSQVEAQLELFRNFSGKAVESAEKLMALNLRTGRASVEQSTAAIRQLVSARDPRDFLALTTQTQQNFESFLAYGRALFSIASGARTAPPEPAATPALSLAPAQFSATPAASPAPQQEAAPAQAAAIPPPAVPTIEASAEIIPAPAPEVIPEPIARSKAMAKAVSQAVAPEAADKPLAATIAADIPNDIAITGIEPVDAAPPPATAAGKPSKQDEAGSGKGNRKK